MDAVWTAKSLCKRVQNESGPDGATDGGAKVRQILWQRRSSMANFKDTLSALGFFWPADRSENRWPGRVYMEGFPNALLYRINEVPGDGVKPLGRGTLHGITDENECVTMLEALGRLNSLSIKGRGTTERIRITARYMLVGDRHFDETPSVRRLSFSSLAAEMVLRLQATDYRSVPHRKIGIGQQLAPILKRQVASFTDTGRRRRVRVFRSTVPPDGMKPTSMWSVHFLDLVSPHDAISVLHTFRNFLSVVCGIVIDISQVSLLHIVESKHSVSDAYFFNPVEPPKQGDWLPMSPIVNLTGDRNIFSKLVGGWISEFSAKKLSRGAFVSVLGDESNLRLSHHRELVTIIEMQANAEGTAPMCKSQSRALRALLQDAITRFAAKDPSSAAWLDVMRKRVDNLNYHDARVILHNFIAALPSGIIELPENFCADVIDFRNILTHDMSKIQIDDYNKLAFFTAKLKAIVALSDVIGLGAAPGDILTSSEFLIRAQNTQPNPFTDNSPI